MPRAFHIPGVFFLFCAFVLLFLVSISLPYLPALDFARVHFDGSPSTENGGEGALTELRYGIWSYCWYQTSGTRTCSPKGHGYSTVVYNSDRTSWQTVGPSWTRGLAVHPVAAGMTFVAFLLSLSTHITVALLASLASFLAALLTLIAFAIDIALYVFVKHQMGKLVGVSEHTDTAPAFWMTFVSFILLCLAGCTVCFGRRRDRMAGATSYSMAPKPTSWRDRFRRS
ncbi:SUR7/PalI family protein [Phanerochaete sordida]|uniref:SUR7/PalI family protein n=1 Tax=Phanerochaete sordida TaxID=48140 RepID=A0A9P3GLB8_9APHY|nr:SUR7/PalI family protein [Phanerochaete sordida]